MHDRTRAWRRAQQKRALKRVRKWLRWQLPGFTQDEIERFARRRVNNPQCCSGFMCCGNLRRLEGPTLQELRCDGGGY